MGTEQKVVIITGASQGIGAELVKGYRDRNYRVVANSRSIKPSSAIRISWLLPATSPIPRRRSGSFRKRSSASAASTRWSTMPASSSPSRSPTTPPKISRRSLRSISAASSSLTKLRRRRDAEAGFRPHRADHDQPGRSRQQQRSLGAGLADQGRIERRHQVAGDRVRKEGHPRQRGVARHHQDADACARNARVPRQSASGRPHGRSQATSSTPCCSWKVRPSSPARSCMSMAARAPATDTRADHSASQRGATSPEIAASSPAAMAAISTHHFSLIIQSSKPCR